MAPSKHARLIAYYVAAVVVAVAVYTVAYKVGMQVFEGREKTLVQSLQVVVESLTTTGYGEDAPWSSPVMNLMAIAMQVTGVVFLFTALPVIALPLLEEALKTRPPVTIDRTDDHVVVCVHDVHAEVLVEDLAAHGVEYVIVEPDRAVAVELQEEGYRVVHGDPESIEVLEGVHADRARAVIVEADDEVNASIVLSAKTAAPETRVVSVAEDPDRADYHRYAGADEVLSPRDLVGERLARKATTTITAELRETVEVGEDIEIAELAVHSGSELVGKRLDESGIRERTGANVLGAWIDGEFLVAPFDRPLDAHSVLLVVGRERECEALNQLTLSPVRRTRAGMVVVAGYGETGSSAVETLAESGVEYTVLDVERAGAVDVVGDATDPEDLVAAGIEEADTLVLTLESDADTVFATLVARELSREVEIIARADDRESVRKIYRAGADYVLALSQVTGRMLAASVLDEELLAFDTQVKVVRVPAGGLAGRTIAGADVRNRTGCTVIAVERDGQVVTGPDPSFGFREGDEVVVAGTDRGIAAFSELAG